MLQLQRGFPFPRKVSRYPNPTQIVCWQLSFSSKAKTWITDVLRNSIVVFCSSRQLITIQSICWNINKQQSTNYYTYTNQLLKLKVENHPTKFSKMKFFSRSAVNGFTFLQALYILIIYGLLISGKSFSFKLQIQNQNPGYLINPLTFGAGKQLERIAFVYFRSIFLNARCITALC